MDWLLLSLLAGLLSAICWLIGDILLLGFTINEAHRQFFKRTRVRDEHLAVAMLSGSTSRLRWGALIANFSIPLMLFSLLALYLITQPSWLMWAALALLGIGFSLSPVAHVAFYYVGTLCKNIYALADKKQTISQTDEALINEYTWFLHIAWRAAVATTAFGWLIFSLLILTSQTTLPTYFAFLTPLTITPLFMVLNTKFKFGSPHLNGAPLNVGLVIFFAAALISVVFVA